jgi:hypothetical protein
MRGVHSLADHTSFVNAGVRARAKITSQSSRSDMGSRHGGIPIAQNHRNSRAISRILRLRNSEVFRGLKFVPDVQPMAGEK